MLAEGIIGHTNIHDALLKAVHNNVLSHALLFTGIKGIGKATTAYNLSKLLLGWPQLIENNTHPDLYVVKTETEEIKIDEIREVINFLNKTSSLSKNKVLIIDGANKLNINSSNALLKALEEPFGNVFLILIFHTGTKLLDTIRSRCAIYKFKPLNLEHFNIIMKTHNLTDEQITDLHYIASGSVGLAKTLIEHQAIKVINSIKNILEANQVTKILLDDESLWASMEILINKLILQHIKKKWWQSEDIEKLIKKYELSIEFFKNQKTFNLDRENAFTTIFS